ncbi:MAG: hypothetical protein ACPGWR_03090 [Ardenticatenaceae bacterium]
MILGKQWRLNHFLYFDNRSRLVGWWVGGLVGWWVRHACVAPTLTHQHTNTPTY